MSTPPSGRSPWLDFNLIAFALLSGESAFVDADLRNRAACSCFILRASASSRIFMSFCTLSNVTKKSLTSLKTLPALSALNGSPKNSVVAFIASCASAAIVFALVTSASAACANGSMTSLNLS